MKLYKMLRKTDEGNIETFYTDDLQVKILLDTERKKSRTLQTIVIRNDSKKSDLQQRQRIASDLRKIKIAKKEVLP